MGVLGTRSYGQELLLQVSRKSWHSLRGDWSFSEVRPTAPSQDSGPAPRWHCPPIPSPAARWDSAPLFHWIVVRRQSSAVNLCGASPSGRKPVSSRQSIDTQRHPLSPEREGSFPATAVSLSLQVEEAAGPKPSCLSERRSLGNQKRTLPVSR